MAARSDRTATEVADHGHGSVDWVLVSGLAMSHVVDEQRRLSASSWFRNLDTPVLKNDRRVPGGLWLRQFGLSDEALGRVFPAAAPRALGLV